MAISFVEALLSLCSVETDANHQALNPAEPLALFEWQGMYRPERLCDLSYTHVPQVAHSPIGQAPGTTSATSSSMSSSPM